MGGPVALAIGDQDDGPWILGAEGTLALLHVWIGPPDAAQKHAGLAIDLATEVGDLTVEFWARWGLAVLSGMRGDIPSMAEGVKAAGELADKLRSPVLRLWTAEMSIEMAYAAGDWDRGIALGEQSIELARDLNQRTLLPRLASLGYDDVVLNTAITRENYKHVNDVAELALDWGVNVSFSAYSPRRTGDRSYMITEPDELAELRGQFDRLLARKDDDRQGRIVNSRTTLEETYQYFVRGGRSGCTAGLRFLVVTADGYLQPCSMQFDKRLDQRELVREFTASNECDECYVAIRSYLDKGFWQLLAENVGDHFSFRLRRDGARAGSA